LDLLHWPLWDNGSAAKLDQAAADAPSRGGAWRSGWLHEIKYDGYRMHARIDGRDIELLTRTGLDWSRRYRRTIEALASLTGAHTHSGLLSA